VTYLPGGGNEIFAVVTRKYKEIVPRKAIPALLRVSKWLCKRQSDISMQVEHSNCLDL
jgi:hypothetical protein